MTIAETIPTNTFILHTAIRHNPQKISKAVLCSIYGILPICLVLMLCDTFFFNSVIRKALPSIPDFLLIYTIFFNEPHIIAGFFSFFDKEYFLHYRKKLLTPALLISLPVLLLPYFFGANGMNCVYLVGLIWTTEHVIGQQFGLTRMMTRAQPKDFFVWRWSGMLIGISLYAGVYAHAFANERRFDVPLEIFSLLLLVPFIAAALAIRKRYTDTCTWDVCYLWLNSAMLVIALLAYTMGYTFFVVLMPRIIHDVTAFMFYAAHDQNRNMESLHNIIYRPFQGMKISVALLCPILAITYVFPFVYWIYLGIPWAYFHHVSPTYLQGTYQCLIQIAFITAFLHFYTDSFVWKQGSLHRQYISIT